MGDASMSIIVEYHECRMVVVIPERVLVPSTWKCTHVNMDGIKCQTMVTGYGRVGLPVSSHMTSSEAITAWFNKDKASDGPEG